MVLAENSRGTARRSVPGRPFAKGLSGNPGGRPKGLSRRIRERTRDGAAIVDFMTGVLDGRIRASVRDRIEAARWLADRGFGRVERPAMTPEQEQPFATGVILVSGTEQQYIAALRRIRWADGDFDADDPPEEVAAWRAQRATLPEPVADTEEETGNRRAGS